ncbi:MAG: ATP-binding protein [Lachnospirales bacterium]
MNLKKRIYKCLTLFSFASIVFITLFSIIIFYNRFTILNKEEIKNKGYIISTSLNLMESEDNQVSYLKEISKEQQSIRISYILSDGTVVFDSHTNIENLDNHKERTEVVGAKEKGFASDTRFSDSINRQTYYYAIKLNNNNILRIAKPIDDITRVFLHEGILPLLFLTIVFLVISIFVSKNISNFLITPINDFNFDLKSKDNVIYDELSPFISKINTQKEEILDRIQKAEESSNAMNKLTENITEGIIIVDKNKTVLLSNKQSDYIIGEALQSKDITNVYQNLEFVNALNKALDGEQSSITIEKNNKFYLTYFVPTMTYNNETSTFVFLFDVTEKAFYENQRKVFTANVSHELKTPLTVIGGLSELIENNMVQEKDIQNFGHKINNEAKNLLKLIDDIIKVSEYDEGNINSDFEVFDLTTMCENIVNELTWTASYKNIEILFKEKPTLVFNGIKRVIEECIFNLVENAIKYSGDVGKVYISLFEFDNYIELHVEDCGMGIADEEKELIFQRFYRVDKSRNKKIEGTGLGLSIVKHGIKLHNGTVTVEDRKPNGSRFIVSLPK